MEEKKTVQIDVNAAEMKVLELMREIEFGQIVVTVKRGVPVHVDEVRKGVNLPAVK